MRAIALLLVMLLVTPAFGQGAWDGLKEQGKVWDTGTNHPPHASQNAVGHTLVVAGIPVYQGMTVAWQSAAHASFSELTSFWFVPYGIVVGAILENRTAPEKVGMFEYNGHAVAGETAKWERDPSRIGWNRLVQYSTFGPGVDKAHDSGMAFDRIGG